MKPMNFGETLKQANTVVVGAGRGIGLEFVRVLLADRRFNRVYATYRCHDRAADLLALQSTYPQRLRCLKADIVDESQIMALVNRLGQDSDRLHLALYCVGLLHDGDLQPEKGLRQLNSDQLMRYFQVNSIGAALLAKHLLPLLKHDQLSVLGAVSAKIGSIGDNRLGGWYGYRASKAALNMLMKTASIEYGRKSPNTILTLLHPGTTNTQLSQPFQRGVPPEKLFSVNRTVSQLMGIIEGLEPSQTGQFFNWDGSMLPW